MHFFWSLPISKICLYVYYCCIIFSRLTSKQNAMNAAEITDKLGLHSLRQRAWVRLLSTPAIAFADVMLSISNQLVLLPVTVFTKGWNGWAIRSEKLDTIRRAEVNSLYPSIYSTTSSCHPPLQNVSRSWSPYVCQAECYGVHAQHQSISGSALHAAVIGS